jgi:hypothetical protein
MLDRWLDRPPRRRRASRPYYTWSRHTYTLTKPNPHHAPPHSPSIFFHTGGMLLDPGDPPRQATRPAPLPTLLVPQDPPASEQASPHHLEIHRHCPSFLVAGGVRNHIREHPTST